MKTFSILFFLQCLISLSGNGIISAQEMQSKSRLSSYTLKAGSQGGFYTFPEAVAQLDSMRLLFPYLISAKDSIFYTLPYPTLVYLRKPIWAVRISDNPDMAENEPKILMLGLIHANEPMSMMQMIAFMWDILYSYANDPDVRFLVNTREIYFIPVLNPDGYLYNQKNYPAGGGTWRLNRQPSWNEFSPIIGIDINRNFSYAFIGENPYQPRFNPYFRGWKPFWAHESYAIMKYCQTKQFTLNINYHVIDKSNKVKGYVIYPWNHTPSLLTPDSTLFRTLAKQIIFFDRFRHGTTYQYSFEREIQYPASNPTGTIEDWMYGVKGTKALTIAIAQGKWPHKDSVVKLAESLIPMNYRAVWSGGLNPNIEEVYYSNANGEPFLRAGESGQMSLNFENKGLAPGNSPFYLSLSTADTHVIIHRSESVIDSLPIMKIMNNESRPFLFSVKPGTPIGHIVNFNLRIAFETEELFRNIQFISGQPECLFCDTANEISNWTKGDFWGHSGSGPSGRQVITESPAGLYYNNTNYRLILKIPVSFRFFREPWLEFNTRWDIEPEFDFATVSASTDGGVHWINLYSKNSRYASGQLPVQADVTQLGYDGYQEDWLKEKIRLKSFEEADSVYIKFELATDGWIVHDGWYLDRIKIMGYPYEPETSYTEKQVFTLISNYPNPFNPATSIHFTVHTRSGISLAVYNVLGQRVARLISNREYMPGTHRIVWDGRNDYGQAASSGVYFYRLETRGFSETKKMLLIR